MLRSSRDITEGEYEEGGGSSRKRRSVKRSKKRWKHMDYIFPASPSPVASLHRATYVVRIRVAVTAPVSCNIYSSFLLPMYVGPSVFLPLTQPPVTQFVGPSEEPCAASDADCTIRLRTRKCIQWATFK